MASVIVHGMILVVMVVGAGRTYLERRQPTLIQLAPIDVAEQREFELQTVPGPPQVPTATRPSVPVPRVRSVQRSDTGRVATIVAPREVPVGIPPSSDSAMVIGTDRVIGPSFAQGRVWVRPLEVELGVIGPSPSVAAHTARIDSALQERILAFIDSMPRDSFAAPAAPTWTSEIDGKTWGIDSKWIYLGGLKLPTALLALLPFPQGNYDEAKRNQELQRIRSIIIQAERRAESSDDFKRYIKDVRRRRDAERAAERARREAARDTVVP
jgi:hypothetical protein